MEHTYAPIDSEGEREQWFGCETCGAKLPESELRLLATKTELVGECVPAPESETP